MFTSNRVKHPGARHGILRLWLVATHATPTVHHVTRPFVNPCVATPAVLHITRPCVNPCVAYVSVCVCVCVAGCQLPGRLVDRSVGLGPNSPTSLHAILPAAVRACMSVTPSLCVRVCAPLIAHEYVRVCARVGAYMRSMRCMGVGAYRRVHPQVRGHVRVCVCAFVCVCVCVCLCLVAVMPARMCVHQHLVFRSLACRGTHARNVALHNLACVRVTHRPGSR